MPCNDSLPDAVAGATPRPLTRAGLRRAPPNVEPTGAFVLIEMTVLFCVTALAMVSIIVSVDEVDPARPLSAATQANHRSVSVRERATGSTAADESAQNAAAGGIAAGTAMR